MDDISKAILRDLLPTEKSVELPVRKTKNPEAALLEDRKSVV